MRWKLIRRRLSISSPRMTVRSHLPWPLRWVVLALTLGFSAALALWAFELGKSLAGLDRGNPEELRRLRAEVAQLREERDKAQSIANTAESLLTAKRVAQERLADQVKDLETENLALKNDLGFFERLLPSSGQQALAVRSLQAEPTGPGQMRYQLLMMQNGKTLPEFNGRYEVTLSGTLDGRPWSLPMPGGARPLQVKQHQRVEGVIDFPAQAVVKQVQVRVTDAAGAVRAQQAIKL
ncbi:DUF6776 family protein [Eleftheria terrae]|uniref:DUF6776 family protein n=1 Tax=Eleftheria terrae TaxID=1597781 RepID=UPI00263A6E11|nr:DUF6776 family protein [Eleftheria terrae]WKB54948.1 hypothetical protein N7L95_11460 [Eleftheria terrae]